MQVETELRDMFSYSIFTIFFIIVLIVIFIVLLKIRKPKIKPKQIVVPKYKDLIGIKKLYLNKVDKLYNDVNNNKIDNRKAYQTLSKLIRNYIYETTNIKVQNYTLSEIKKLNMPILYELVNEYYDPEFSKKSVGNIINSIHKTRSVIERWK